MTVQEIDSGSESLVTVVSNDSHVGPRMDQLHTYCPEKHLDAFDAFADASAESKKGALEIVEEMVGDPRYVRQFRRSQLAAGHNDVGGRLADMDRDGIAAEVIFHGSANLETLPFVGGQRNEPHIVSSIGGDNDFDLVSIGYQIYNRWLADMTAAAPSRFVALAQIPMWDLDAAITEMTWARDHGMRGVSFPAPREPYAEYDDPHWEPFWAAAEDLNLVLATHSGAGGWPSSGPQARAMFLLEVGGWLSRRGMHRMILGGVFERHPGLKLVLTEQMGGWWSGALRDMDSVWKTNWWLLREQVPRLPSEYAASNVFVGASMMANFEAEMAIRDGYVDNMLWGRDYPHPEGAWQFRDAEEDIDVTRLSMRHAFGGIPEAVVRKMAGENAIAVYDLDAQELRRIAASINSPTIEELTTPIETIPANGSPLAFRTVGAWG